MRTTGRGEGPLLEEEPAGDDKGAAARRDLYQRYRQWQLNARVNDLF